MDLSYIHELVDMDKYYLYYKDEPILSAQGMKALKAELKEKVEPPEENRKVFVVSFGFRIYDEKYPFMVACYGFTITKNLGLFITRDNIGFNFVYSKKDLSERRFKLSDVIKIIHWIQNESFADYPFHDNPNDLTY